MELRPGLKDVRRPAELMHAYIVLSLLAGIRTEEARALRWQHVDLDGDPAASPPVPPHVAVWRSVRGHRDTKTERSRRTLGLPAAAVQALRDWQDSQAGERLGRGRLARHRAGLHHLSRRRPRRGQRPENVQTHLHPSRNRRRLDPAGAAHLLRQPAQPPRRPPSRKSPASSGTPPPAPPKSSTAANYDPSSPPAPKSWTSSSKKPRPPRQPDNCRHARASRRSLVT